MKTTVSFAGATRVATPLMAAALLAVATCVAPTADAAALPAWQDLAAVQAAAVDAAGKAQASGAGDVATKAAALDPRLRLAACDAPLEAEAPTGRQTSARLTVAVRCTGSTPWRVYVPVQVEVSRDVVVAAQPLERGRILASGDVILAPRDAGTTATGYLTAIEAAVGRVVRRGVPAGAVIGPATLESPVLVRRGQAISVQARSGPIAVSMAGIAQSEGALGEMISVRNVQSKRILQGIVRNEKLVEIPVP